MDYSNLPAIFISQVRRALAEEEEELFGLDDVLHDLQLKNWITEEEGDQICRIESEDEQVAKLLSILDRKPLSAYDVFSTSIKQHAPNFYETKLKHIEDTSGESMKVVQYVHK